MVPMTKHVTVRGGPLAVVDEGQGPPLLFVHGFPLDHSMWREQRASFARTRRVLLPDLRGFGASPPAHPSGQATTMQDFADDLAALLDALGVDEPVCLCALSMGGYVAWQFAQRHAARLSGLVLCDTRALADTDELRRAREATAERALAEGSAFLADSMPAQLLAAATRAARPELVQEVRAQMLRASPAGVAAAARGMALRPDVRDWLPRCPVPSLVIVGAEDVISTPDEMRAIARALPRSTFREVPHAGHLTPLEQPQAVQDAMGAFLASLAR